MHQPGNKDIPDFQLLPDQNIYRTQYPDKRNNWWQIDVGGEPDLVKPFIELKPIVLKPIWIRQVELDARLARAAQERSSALAQLARQPPDLTADQAAIVRAAIRADLQAVIAAVRRLPGPLAALSDADLAAALQQQAAQVEEQQRARGMVDPVPASLTIDVTLLKVGRPGPYAGTLVLDPRVTEDQKVAKHRITLVGNAVVEAQYHNDEGTVDAWLYANNTCEGFADRVLDPDSEASECSSLGAPWCLRVTHETGPADYTLFYDFAGVAAS